MTLHHHRSQSQICGESRFLPTPPAFDTPSKALPKNIALTFGEEKLEWCGYMTGKKFEDMITRFDTIHKRDRQTDRHIDIRHRPHRAAKTER